MAISDPVNNIYMHNMFLTGSNGQKQPLSNNALASYPTNNVYQTPQTGQISSIHPQQTTGVSGNSTSASFSQMLSGMMAMNTAGMGSDVASFDDAGLGSADAMGGLLGMGSGMSGADGASETNMLLMLVILMLAKQNEDGQNSSLLNNMSAMNVPTNGQGNLGQCNHAHNNASMASPGGVQGIPSNSWVAANAPLTNQVGQRSPQTYRAIIDQFNVESNPRYTVNKQGRGDTYCNIFTWDVTRAMGAEVPHFVNTATGQPVASAGRGVTELNANQVNNWLNHHGATYGWVKVTAEEAQYYANMGMPAITSWKNPAGHGHLQVVSPSSDGSYNPAKGVTIAQAGRVLKNYDYISSVYGAGTMPYVEYYVHV